MSTEIAAKDGLLTAIASNILTRVTIADFMGDPTTGAIPTRFEARLRARETYRTACGPRDSRAAAEVSAPISASMFGNVIGSVVAIRTSIVGALRRTAMAFMGLKRDFRIMSMKAGENGERACTPPTRLCPIEFKHGSDDLGFRFSMKIW